MDTKKNYKIFVIDDDASVCSMIESVLRHIGFDNICSFTSALDAIEKIKEFGLPEFIFLDFLMPNMNGKKFLDLIIEKFPSNNTGFCVISGCSDLKKEDIRDSYFILKPFRIESIKEVLDDFYKKKNI